MNHLRILHLVGSPDREEYCDISRMYAQNCIQATADPDRYDFLIAYVSTDRIWRFPSHLDRDSIADAEPFTFSEAVVFLAKKDIDVAVPHMFCISGMTKYRALLDLLKIPYVGNRPTAMAIAADKAKARAVVSAEGVRVPKGVLLRRGDLFDPQLPVIVKPTNTDNSVGVTLVRQKNDYQAALKVAFAHSDEVLVEQFIELGREVRCGVVMQGNEMVCLPLKEYWMDSQKRPIRAYEDKLKRNEQKEIELAVKEGIDSWAVAINDPVVPRVWEMAKQCHLALGCRHYSLFDIRIDPAGQCWFIEAALYCSFAPGSVLVAMMSAAGTPVEIFFQQMLQQAMSDSIALSR